MLDIPRLVLPGTARRRTQEGGNAAELCRKLLADDIELAALKRYSGIGPQGQQYLNSEQRLFLFDKRDVAVYTRTSQL